MSEKVQVGSIVEGKVVRIKPFGAIVSLPDNTQGLVHISHISTSFVQNIEDFLNVGDVINVKVLSSDPTTGKISLSIKETMQSTKPPAKDNFSGGSDFSGHDRQKSAVDSSSPFEDKFKEWLKASNERHAGLNKRNKRK